MEIVSAIRWIPLSERAMEVQRLLAKRGQGRIPLPDLMIAAAETCEAVLHHYDRDFDRFAPVAGQPTHWIVPSGTAV